MQSFTSMVYCVINSKDVWLNWMNKQRQPRMLHLDTLESVVLVTHMPTMLWYRIPWTYRILGRDQNRLVEVVTQRKVPHR